MIGLEKPRFISETFIIQYNMLFLEWNRLRIYFPRNAFMPFEKNVILWKRVCVSEWRLILRFHIKNLLTTVVVVYQPLSRKVRSAQHVTIRNLIMLHELRLGFTTGHLLTSTLFVSAFVSGLATTLWQASDYYI